MTEPWKNLKAGDRVELVHSSDLFITWGPGTRGVMLADAPQEPDCGFPIQDGPGGDVLERHTLLQAKWDNGSWLHMIPETGDLIKKVEPDAVCPVCNSAENAQVVEFNVKPEGGWWRCCEKLFEHRVVVEKVSV